MSSTTDVAPPTEDYWTFVSKFPTPTDVEDYYDKWATTYDDDMRANSYNGPTHLARLMLKHVPIEARVLCVAVGTGEDGVALHRVGYRNIDAHDGSNAMLAVAMARGVFKEGVCEMLQPEPAESTLTSAAYDAWVCVGSVFPGGLDERHVVDLLRVLKPGGTGVIGVRANYARANKELGHPYDLEARITKLAEEGVIRLTERTQIDDFCQQIPGIFYVMQKVCLTDKFLTSTR